MNTVAKKQLVVFCDFDGTITEKDNIVAIFDHFQPTGYREWIQELMDGKISIKTCVGGLFEMLPTSNREAIERQAIDPVRIRAGFAEWLSFCKDHHVSFYVTSGGIDFFVYPLLAPFDIERDHIYCNASDFSGDQIKIVWPHQCDEHCSRDCGMCKPSVMRHFPVDQFTRIVIGDGITDVAAAQLADRVYARSSLLKYCESNGIASVPYQTFTDIQQDLERWMLQNA